MTERPSPLPTPPRAALARASAWLAPAALVLLTALLATGCARDRVHDELVLQWYDIDEDIELGNDTLDRFLTALDQKKVPYDHDPRMLAKIQDIVARVTKVSHYPELPWEVHLAKLKDVNAWCAPGGKIVVYEGLYKAKDRLVTTEYELAFILAHEAAHATARHITRARSRQYTLMVGAFPVWLGLSLFIPGAGDAFGLVFNQGLNIYLPSFSREQEEEADALGLIYMARAGYDPRAASRIWTRAAKRQTSNAGLYSTHPDHAARAAAIDAMMPDAIKIFESAKAERAAAKAAADAAPALPADPPPGS